MQAATDKTRAQHRQSAIAKTVAKVTKIESSQGVNPKSLEAIKCELMDLAAKTELFPVDDFPPPADAAASQEGVDAQDAATSEGSNAQKKEADVDPSKPAAPAEPKKAQ